MPFVDPDHRCNEIAEAEIIGSKEPELVHRVWQCPTCGLLYRLHSASWTGETVTSFGWTRV